MRIFVVPLFVLCLSLAAVLFSGAAGAQGVKSDPSQLLTPPIMLDPPNPDGSRCFNLWNTAPYTVTGSMVTALYETADATKARQRLNFRLAPKENRRFCAFGPFYPGERLELVIRTLVPIFSCYTVAQGDIIIKGEMTKGVSKTWAECQ
jgi:hypothetical protein